MNICEHCGKEHDGSYGSGRFCSERCKNGYSGVFGSRTLNLSGKRFGHKQYNIHKKAKEGGWKCKYCEFVGITRRDLYAHLRKMRKNGSHSRTSWNKGLTKETSVSLKLKGEKISKLFRGRPGHKQTEESRRKISETGKARHSIGGYRIGSGWGKKGWYKGFWCDSSWELAFILYCLDHNIEIKKNTTEKFQYVFNGNTRFYVPDFKMPDGSWIEIKGRKEITDEVQAKLDAVGNIKILLSDDMKMYLDYTTNRYGKDFVRLLESNT